MTDLVSQHLARANARMIKLFANAHHSERSFLVGDWVFAKMRPYARSSLASRANQKLAFKYFEPYQVIGSRISFAIAQVFFSASRLSRFLA